MVQHVEGLDPELEPRVSLEVDRPDQGYVEVRVLGRPRDVPARIAELARVCLRIEPLERGSAQPLVDRVRTDSTFRFREGSIL